MVILIRTYEKNWKQDELGHLHYTGISPCYEEWFVMTNGCSYMLMENF
jgi:hypothetical protein